MPTESHLDLTIRQAEVADAHAMADLYSAARVAAVPMMPPAMHTNAEDRVWMAARLAEDHEAWLAERDGGSLGYALLTPTWLDHLFIGPDQTGQGIGGVLLDVVKSLRPDGFELWVFESNVGARAFYRHRGARGGRANHGAANEEKAPTSGWPGGQQGGQQGGRQGGRQEGRQGLAVACPLRDSGVLPEADHVAFAVLEVRREAHVAHGHPLADGTTAGLADRLQGRLDVGHVDDDVLALDSSSRWNMPPLMNPGSVGPVSGSLGPVVTMV